MLAVGLMSGTSLDGIDAALVRIEPRGAAYDVELLAYGTTPFDDDLASAIRSILPPNDGTVAEVAQLHHRLGVAFARAARNVAGASAVDYIACHGLTIWHDGAAHTTLQIGDAFAIREALSSTICYDFRSADCAVGGHGAPLVPYVDALLLADPDEDRVAINIGGIANLTALGRGVAPHDVLAFDTGPGNMLLDALVRARTAGEQSFDDNGAYAREGRVAVDLLAALLEEPYFAQAPPKSTGRERFGSQFLDRHHAAFDRLSLPDAAATLTELTAASIAAAVVRVRLAQARILISGGGASNGFLMERLQARLPDACVETVAAVGMNAGAKEAVAFALLGYETLRARAGNVPRVTGASRAVPLGAIAPFELTRLLSEVERECRNSS